MDKVSDRVKNIIVKILGVERSQVNLETRFREDLMADSLDFVELIMACEEEFGIVLADENVTKVETVGDAVRLISLYLSGTIEQEDTRQGTSSRDYKSEALAAFDKSLELNPFQFDARYSKSQILYEMGKLDEAVAELDRAIKINPLFEDAFLLRGMIHMDLKLLEKALEDFVKATKLNPLSRDANFYAGSVYKAMDDNERALDYLNRALKIDPLFTYALFQRFAVYSDLNDKESAAKDAQRLNEIDPDFLHKLR